MPVTLEAALDFQKQLAANRLVLSKNQLKKQRRRMKELFEEAAAATSEDGDPNRKRRCRPGKRGREAAAATAAKSKQQSSTEQSLTQSNITAQGQQADLANADQQAKRRKKKRCKEPAASHTEQEIMNNTEQQTAADLTGLRPEGVKTVHVVDRADMCADDKQLVRKKGKKRQRVRDGLPVDTAGIAAANAGDGAIVSATANVESAPGDNDRVVDNKQARKKARKEGKRVRLPSVESGSDYCRKKQASESGPAGNDAAGTDAVTGTVNDAVNGADAVDGRDNDAGNATGAGNGTITDAVNGTFRAAQPARQPEHPAANAATVSNGLNTGNPQSVRLRQVLSLVPRSCKVASKPAPKSNASSAAAVARSSNISTTTATAATTAATAATSTANISTTTANVSTTTANISTTTANISTTTANISTTTANISTTTATAAHASAAAPSAPAVVTPAVAATVQGITRAAVSTNQPASTAPMSSSLASAWTTHPQITSQHPNTTNSTLTVEAQVASTTNCNSKSLGLAESAGGGAGGSVKRLKKSKGMQPGGQGGDEVADGRSDVQDRSAVGSTSPHAERACDASGVQDKSGACDASGVQDRSGACDRSEGHTVASTAGQAERACDRSGVQDRCDGQAIASTAGQACDRSGADDASEGQGTGSVSRQVAGAGGVDPGLSRKKLRPQYLYGNYHRYYGKRLAGDLDHDPRIKAIKGHASWLRDKRCIDVGCNEGILTLQLATQFSCQSMLGVDIDAGLVGKACRHLSELRHKFVEQMDRQHQTGLNCGGRPFHELRSAAKALSATVFAHEEWVHTPARKNSADVVFCFSVTKWVHLHFGDEGVKELFAKVVKVLAPGGVFVLEPQPWSSYENSRRKPGMLSVTYCKGMQLLELRPEQFVSYLTTSLNMKLLKEVQLEDEGGATQGFGRPIYILQKADVPVKV